MKSKKNKQRLARILGTFNLGENVKMETPDDGLFDHDEADVTIVSYMLECAKSKLFGCSVMILIYSSFWCTGFIEQMYNVVFKWNDGTVLY